MLRTQVLHTSATSVAAGRDDGRFWRSLQPGARETTAAVNGGIRALRLEGLAMLVAASVMYARSGFGWGLFALFFLAPDLSFLGYLAGNRIGAIAYNAAHSYVGALTCFSAGLLLVSPELEVAGLIWCAHIGFDRALGYGLKYAAGFGFTHLGRIGRDIERTPVASASSNFL
jgi:Domain of unknown function (DUF4260)